MKIAYSQTSLSNLLLIKELQHWKKNDVITSDQFSALTHAYPSNLYHPNFIIRILLFLATLIALSGITGMLGLFVSELGETIIYILCSIYGVVSFIVLEKQFLQKSNHYKSGVTEGILYHAVAFTIIGIAGITDYQLEFLLLTSFLVLGFAAIRYLDIICTTLALVAFAGLIFDLLYKMGTSIQPFIPVVFLFGFIPIAWLFRKLKSQPKLEFWWNNLLVGEVFSLILLYAAGNYLVVRELSIEMMGMSIGDGEDIPLAWFFYFTTIAIPVVSLWQGIRKKDLAMLRVSLFLLAFSVFTFKYYYSTGHPEITLTVCGSILLLTTILLLRYLKTPRKGFTRERLISEKWMSANMGAIFVSQTLGGNQVQPDTTFTPGGGTFGGGGASGGF